MRAHAMCFCGREVVYFFGRLGMQFSRSFTFKMKVTRSGVAKGVVFVGKTYSNFY